MALEVESYLRPISDATPSGENIEYDDRFLELERIAQGTPEQQVGDTVVAAEEPNWRDVRAICLDLLERTRDLRVALYLVVGAMKTEGYVGLRDALAILKGLLERFWDSVYPQLDPDDNNDPLERINVLTSLCPEEGWGGVDPISFLRRLREIPLAQSRVGAFGLRDIYIARGEWPVPPGLDRPPDGAVIEAAFRDTDPETLRATYEAVVESAKLVESIEAILGERCGSGSIRSLSPAVQELQRAGREIAPYVEGGEAPPSGAASAPAGEAPGAMAVGSGGGAALSGEIRSGQDVVRALEKICDYYRRAEPSSPVPLLLRRAKRLVSADFLTIARDLTPDALQQIGMIGGLDRDELESGQ